MRGKGKIRIWPAYFDIRFSRGEGRRVPRDRAVRDPKLEDLEKVSRKLGLNPIIQPENVTASSPGSEAAWCLLTRRAQRQR